MKTILLSLIWDVNREMDNIGKPNNLREVWSTEFTIFHSIFPEIVSETSASTDCGMKNNQCQPRKSSNNN